MRSWRRVLHHPLLGSLTQFRLIQLLLWWTLRHPTLTLLIAEGILIQCGLYQNNNKKIPCEQWFFSRTLVLTGYKNKSMERFSSERRKTKTSPSQITTDVNRAKTSKQIHVMSPKRGKTRASKARLVLIGWESGASFANESQRAPKQIKARARANYFRHSNEKRSSYCSIYLII